MLGVSTSSTLERSMGLVKLGIALLSPMDGEEVVVVSTPVSLALLGSGGCSGGDCCVVFRAHLDCAFVGSFSAHLPDDVLSVLLSLTTRLQAEVVVYLQDQDRPRNASVL